MKNVTKLLSISALALIATASLGSVSADFSEKGSRGERSERPEPTAEKQAEMEAHKTAVEEAVKNNNFDAFEALRAEQQAKMEAKMSERMENSERPEKVEPTAAEKLEKFNELVSYYNENGELPKKEMKKKGKRKGTLNNGQKGKVRAVLNNIDDPDKLQRVLTRIDQKITSIESSDMDETRKDEILGLLEGIKELFEEAVSS